MVVIAVVIIIIIIKANLTTGVVRASSFYSNVFPLWCNVLIRFCCTMVSLMTTGQSRVHFHTTFVISVIFEPRVFPGIK